VQQDTTALNQLAKIATQGFADEQTLTQAASVIRQATGAAEAMVVYAQNEDFLVCTDAGNGAATSFTQTALWVVQRQTTELGGPVAFNLVGHRVEGFTSALSDEQREFLALSMPTSEGASEMCILRGVPEHKGRATILRLMESATPALTIILERFLNIGRSRRYGEKLSALANAAQLLAQSENLEAALTDLATAIAASTGSDYVSIDVYDANTERFVLRALSQSRFAGLSVTQAWIDLLDPDRPEPRNQEVMRTRQPYLSPNVQNDEREPEAVRRYCEATLISSMATFPMLFQDEFLGTAAFVYYAPHTFPSDEISFLQGFVTQAATALKALQMHNELQRYAHEIKRSADEYIGTTNMTGDIIVRLDEHGRWVLLNDAACQFFGRPRDELLGAQSTDYVHPEDVASTTQAIRETRARKELIRGFVHRFLTALGPRVVEWDAWPLFDEQGQYTGTQITGRDITERKQMEEALAAKTKEYIDTTNLTGDVIVKVAEDGRVTLLNDAACEFFGKTREELLGVKYTDYVHPEDIEPTVQTVQESAVKKELVRSFVNRMITPAGIRVVEWNGYPIFDEDGQYRGFQATGRDITERKQMEDVLAAKTGEYIATTNLTGDLIARMDKNGNWVFLNDAACQFYGKPREELLGTDSRDFAHPDDLEATAQAIRGTRASKELVRGFVNRQITPMGTRVVEWNGYPIFDEEGQYAGIQITGRDITERKQMEEALRESEARYRLLTENTSDLIWTVDLSLTYTYMSPAITRMRGYTAEEIVGVPIKETMTPASLEVARRTLAEQLAMERMEGTDPNRSAKMEVEMYCKDGSTIWTEMSMVFLRDSEGKPTGILGVTRNISERKRMEEEIRRRNQELAAFLDLSRTMASTIEFDELLQKALDGVSELLPQADAVSLAIYNRYKDVLEIKAARGTKAKALLKMVLKPGEGIEGKALQLGKSVLYSSPAEVCAALANMAPSNRRLRQQVSQSGSPFQSAICSPLVAEGRTLGSLLVATSAADAPFQPSDVALLEAAASHIAVALDKAQLHADTKLRAITDGLTGLYNHAHFFQRLAEEIDSSKRYKRRFAVVMMDVDAFKHYNDSRGHQAGDDALRLIADCTRTSIRGSDLAFRYGGDEFATILLNADSARAQTVVNRINRHIAAGLKKMDDQAAAWLGLSAGIASFPEDATTVDDLVQMADAALYNAKHLAWARSLTEPEQAIESRPYPHKVVHETQAGMLTTAAGSLATVLRDLGVSEVAAALDLRAIAAVGAASEIKDRYMRGHQERASLWAAALAEDMGLPSEQVRNIRIAGLLHDIGKVSINDGILNKPGKLTEEEFAKVKRHAPIGAEIMLSEAEALQQLAAIVRYHHEHFDGTGYPDGIAGEQIPLEARIMAVVDVFDAMTHERSYRKALSREETIAELERGAGTQFDPAVVKAFLALLKRRSEEAAAPAQAASEDRRLAAAKVAAGRRG